MSAFRFGILLGVGVCAAAFAGCDDEGWEENGVAAITQPLTQHDECVTPNVERVTNGIGGAAPNGPSSSPVVSEDGRYVAFVSTASNLVPNDTNGVADIFRYDRVTGLTTRVSVGESGTQSNGSSSLPSMSADGRYFAFTTIASNFDAINDPADSDVYFHDISTGLTLLASIDKNGNRADDASQNGTVSPDGSFVLFESKASDLFKFIDDVAIVKWDLSRRRVIAHLTLDTSGITANDACNNPYIAAGGSRFAFDSLATDLVSPSSSPSNTRRVFLRDLNGGNTLVVGTGVRPRLDPTARYVSYISNAGDALLYDRVLAVTEVLNVGLNGFTASGTHFRASVLEGGRFVAYDSTATTLVAGDTNGVSSDIFFRDRLRAVNLVGVLGLGGQYPDGASLRPEIPADGKWVVFESSASNLVAGDTNGVSDIFIAPTPLNTCTPDSCARIDVGSATGTEVVAGSTIGLSDGYRSTCGGGGAPDAAYKWIAPYDGLFEISTKGSSFNTVLTVLKGGCLAPQSACDDNGFTDGTSRISILLPRQTEITIIVDGNNGTSGPYKLNITGSPRPEVCDDRTDNDGDDLADCLDPDCADAACSDGLKCTVGEICQGTTCSGAVPRVCDDGISCTTDTCSEFEANGCRASVKPDFCLFGGECIPAETINPNNACQACQPSTSTSQYTNRPAGTVCDDGLYCTVGETCQAGACTSSAPRDCSSFTTQCRVGKCDEQQDACIGDPAPRNGQLCNDGQYCTTNEQCSDGNCGGGTARSCDDSNSCTVDTCNEALDQCSSAPLTDGCTISGICYARGVPNPLNSCQVCDPTRSATQWSSAVNGAVCDDGLFCSSGDACFNGVCTGASRNCSDGLSCTTDTCDEAADACKSVLNSGNCLIGGACVATNTVNPTNGCQSCQPSISTSAYSSRANGSACDDGLYCTVNDTCTAGSCGGASRSCSDGLSCTSDSCNEATDACVNAVSTGCVVNGTCVATGAANPLNQCQSCQPSVSTSAYSNKVNGTTCDDGLYCTVDDVCTAGSCGGATRDCRDSLACTSDSCSEASDACVNAVSTGCVVNGSCVAANAANPSNQCQSCQPSVSTSAYSNRVNGTTCDDGLFCTVNDACTGGSCGGASRDCGDGLSCTSDTCSESTDACVNTLSGGCLIGGACVAANTVSPTNGCQSCQPSISTAAYSSRANGSACDDGLYCTVNDTCTGGNCGGVSRDCSDNLTCTSDSCNEATDACVNSLEPGNCNIDSTCYGEGVVNPANACLVCSAATPSTWAFVAANTACGPETTCSDGIVQFAAFCDGSGKCDGPEPIRCIPYVNCATTTACATSCTSGDDCDDGFRCLDAMCRTNSVPVADAGAEQLVGEDDVVTLDGRASSDADGDSMNFAWAQVAGPEVSLNDPASRTPAFTAPRVFVASDIMFELAVSDPWDPAGSPATVTIRVGNTINEAPVADAGDDVAGLSGEVVTLSGIASSDPNDDPLTYLWSQSAGPVAGTSDVSGSTLDVTLPAVADATELVFDLIVNDGNANSPLDVVRVAVSPRSTTDDDDDATGDDDDDDDDATTGDDDDDDATGDDDDATSDDDDDATTDDDDNVTSDDDDDVTSDDDDDATTDDDDTDDDDNVTSDDDDDVTSDYSDSGCAAAGPATGSLAAYWFVLLLVLLRLHRTNVRKRRGHC